MDYPSIGRSLDYHALIDRLASDKDPELDVSLFPTIRDLLLFAATLGFAENNPKPIKKRDEPVRMAIFESVKAEEIIFLIALATTKDHSILKHDPDNMKRCVSTFEELANGGLEIIHDWVFFKYSTMTPDRAILSGLQDLKYAIRDSENLDDSALQNVFMAV